MAHIEKLSAVGYVFSEECFQLVNGMPKIAGRAARVHSLIENYELLNKMRIIKPTPVSDECLLQFHSSDYLDYIKKWSSERITIFQKSEESEDFDEEIVEDGLAEDEMALEEYGFGYDCPLMKNVLPFVRQVAGSSVSAAQAVVKGEVSCAINWFGGWHHAKRSNASGFCYVNDVVLCIFTLLRKFDNVLYIDLDLHHGDGVEEAFYNSPRIMTLSFHLHKDGFFPGTGLLEHHGSGKGLYHNVNVPLQEGLDDEMFCSIFDQIFGSISANYPYKAIVCQSGCDALSGDPMKGFNWTEKSFLHVAETIRNSGIPVIFLGGGGYNFPNVARCWTSLTAALCGVEIDSNIPDHEFFTEYKPGFDLAVNLLPMYNRNEPDKVNMIVSALKNNLLRIKIQ